MILAEKWIFPLMFPARSIFLPAIHSCPAIASGDGVS